ncbi:HEAT repeat domain-containing protein [Brevibacillus daliensis]|uniref:HEAT repeat domain-containing protein n=1 Tax=Brevibacillus daliensis TaxID=2892995 RepID=UPI001E522498|nr:HEAT repeat domain-containing protein [Brevibacillus daliensis]
MNKWYHLSDESEKLIEKLFTPQVEIGNIYTKQHYFDGIFNEIKIIKEPAILPYLLSFILQDSSVFKRSGYEALYTLVEGIVENDHRKWIKIQEFLHSSIHYSDEKLSGWNEVKPEKITQFAYHTKEEVLLLGLVSFHRNGYVREAAVKLLHESKHTDVVPFLLLRLNDHVSPIRFQAYKALKKRLTKNHAHMFFQSLLLINHVHEFSRDKYTVLQAEINSYLHSLDCRPELLTCITSSDIHNSRACVDLALSLSETQRDEVISLAIQSSDAEVRKKILHNVMVINPKKWFKEIVMMVEDRNSSIKQEALLLLWQYDPEFCKPYVMGALVDSSTSVRRLAQFLLREKTEQPISAFYRQKLPHANHNELSSVIAGLGETGEARDAEQLAAYLHYPVFKIQRVTIQAIERLHADAYKSLFLEKVEHTSKKVSRTAKEAVFKLVTPEDKELLKQQLAQATMSHVKKNIAELLYALPRKTSLRTLLEATMSTDKIARNYVFQQLKRWLTQWQQTFFTSFSVDEMDEIRELITMSQQQKSWPKSCKHLANEKIFLKPMHPKR